MEIWRDIPCYEGIYQASTYGQIRTAPGKITSNARYGTRRWKSRILKGRGDNAATGRRVSLWKDGTVRDWLVARLVATTFLGSPPEGFTVNHKDGNRFNNHIDNLEWLSIGDNIRHGFETGLYSSQKPISGMYKGEVYSFRSYAELNRFLGKGHHYTSEALKKGRQLKDRDGVPFEPIQIGGV